MAGKALSRNYTPEEVDRGLLAYAVTGNYATAEGVLKAQGVNVPRSTLRHWVKKLHSVRYSEISNAHSSEYLERMKTDLREILNAAAEATLEGVRTTRADLAKLEPRDKAGAVRNLATTFGISFDKLAALEDRPAAIVEHHATADDLLLKLQSIIGSRVDPERLAINVTAEDVTGEDEDA